MGWELSKSPDLNAEVNGRPYHNCLPQSRPLWVGNEVEGETEDRTD